MKKNVAGQFVGAQMINASTGAAFTGAVTAYVTGDAGTQALGSVGSGACTHEGNGYHTYAPSQAETNYDLVAVTFIGTGAIPVTVQIYTSSPQSGDAYARLGAPAGASVSADVAAVKAVLPAALVSGRIDASVGAMANNVLTASAINADAITAAKLAADVTTELQAGLATAAALTTVSGKIDVIDDYIDTEIAAIKAKTDTLPSDPADASDIAAAVAAVSAKIDTVDDFVDTEVAAIKAVTDKLDTAMESDGGVYRFTTNALEQAPSGGGSIPTAAQIADEVQTRTIAGVTEVTRLASQERNDIADAYLDRANAIEVGLTPRQAMRLGAMADAGNMIVTGSSVTGKNFGNTKTRLQATGDEQGNRTVTSTDVT